MEVSFHKISGKDNIIYPLLFYFFTHLILYNKKMISWIKNNDILILKN